MTTPPAPAVPPAPGLAEIEDFLCATLAELTPAAPGPGARGPGPTTVLPALALWAGPLVCVLRGFGSHLVLWQLLTSGDFWHCPRVVLSEQAVYHRLARDGTAPLADLFQQVGTFLVEYPPLALAPGFRPQHDPAQPGVVDVARTVPSARHLRDQQRALADHYRRRCSLDAWHIYETCIPTGGLPAIPRNTRGHPAPRLGPNGHHLCPRRHEMVPTYAYNHPDGYRAQTLACPLRTPSQTGAPCDHAQFAKGVGCPAASAPAPTATPSSISSATPALSPVPAPPTTRPPTPADPYVNTDPL